MRFNVHEQRLRKTSFFEKHGEPPVQDEQQPGVQAQGINGMANGQTQYDMEGTANIKSEDVGSRLPNGMIEATRTNDNLSSAHPQASAVHYTLEGNNFSDPKAFKIFVDWLYKEYPEPIQTRRQIQIALKAYVLALEYNAYSLQNMLLDRFREHYTWNKVKFDDLIWVINWVEVGKPDGARVAALTSYLIEQVAFEISDNGYDEFEKENWFFKPYLEEGERKHRRDLVRVLARHAHSARPTDPATKEFGWYVATEGVEAGIWREPREG